jgi:rubrerythrin
MSKLFYLSEIVKFAIEKEQESFDLYQKLANQINDENVKVLFQKLAQQEIHHKSFYSNMLESVKPEQSPGVKEDGEYHSYMESLIAGSRIIPTLSATDFNNPNKVFDYAIAREKDSVLFYSGMKNFVAPSAHASIDHIIQEEEKHVAVLLAVKAKYK